MKNGKEIKKKLKILFFIILLMIILFLFYKINNLNYIKHTQIRFNIVRHPEWVANKDFAKYTSFWFKNLRADLYWLEIVQYIWSNAISSEYKKYLYKMLDLITELNPYFEHPYLIWELLLPSYNERYEKLSKEEQENYTNQAILIWEKWIKNFCDLEKIKKIENEENLYKILNEDQYKNPCKSFNIPYYLAYIHYFYKNDPETSAKYYKITSANEAAPEWVKIMAAIMEWKWWNREKSFFMFLNIAMMIEKDDKVCNYFSSELQRIWTWIFNWQISLNWSIIKNIETIRKESFGKYEDDDISDTKCENYANKATRELNLYYVELWNQKFKNDNNWKSATDSKELFEKWYIDYNPIDFQQYDDYWIMYKYNKDIWRFDYEMSNYDE